MNGKVLGNCQAVAILSFLCPNAQYFFFGYFGDGVKPHNRDGLYTALYRKPVFTPVLLTSRYEHILALRRMQVQVRLSFMDVLQSSTHCVYHYILYITD